MTEIINNPSKKGPEQINEETMSFADFQVGQLIMAAPSQTEHIVAVLSLGDVV